MPRPISSNPQSIPDPQDQNPNHENTLPSPHRIIPSALFALCVALLFSGCPTTSDVMSRNDIATLKTTHLAFIDEFTEGAGKTWDDQKLSARTAAVFNELIEAQRAAAKQFVNTQAIAGKARARELTLTVLDIAVKKVARIVIAMV